MALDDCAASPRVINISVATHKHVTLCHFSICSCSRSTFSPKQANMDHIENIPQQFNGQDLLALSKAVIKFLQKDKADALALAKSNSQEFSVAKVARALMCSSFLARPSTPCRNDRQLSRSSSFSSNASTPLKRTLSFSSTSSQSSASTPIKRDSPFSSSTAGARRKKRRTICKNTQLQHDIVVVTRPVLELLDSDWLADPQSKLFVKEFRQQKDRHGRRVKRLNATMDETKFDELTHPILHELLQGENDPRARHSLKQRYRYAMMKVVKKRRANHVQKWRMCGHPMRMVYGGGERYQHLFVNNGGADPSQELQSQSPDTEESQAADIEESQRQPDTEESQRQPYTEESQSPGAEESQSPDAEQSKHMAFRCADCVTKRGWRAPQLPRRLLFPSTTETKKWGGSTTELRCAPCWESYQRTTILPHVCNEEERSKRTAQLGKRKAGGPQSREKKKQQRAQRTQCKWCNSTTHLTRGSKDCPYNKKTKVTIFFSRDGCLTIVWGG